MKAMIRVLVLGAALAAWPLLLSRPAPVVALGAIGAGVLAAWSLEGRLHALVVAAGAAAALALVTLAPWSVPLGGAAFALLASAPRALRVEGRPALGAHAALAAIGGAVGAHVALRYGADASAAVRAASLVTAGIVASVATLVPAQDPVARALADLAAELTGDVSAALSRAAALRRRTAGGEVLRQLPEDTATRIDAGWSALVRTATRRAELGAELAAGAAVIDRRIAAHVDVLERIHAAATERLAHTMGLEDPGIAAATLERDGIEAEVRALAEITSGPSAQA